MALLNQKQKEKYNKDVKKYFTTKRVLIAVIALFVFIMFSAQLKGVLLLILFFPLAKYSVKVTAFVPHVTLEQYTSATLLMAYLYGPVVGAVSGFMLGFYGYFSNGISKFLALVNVFIAGFIGFMLGHLVKNGFLRTWSFYSAFVLGILVFNAIAFVIFFYVDSDKLQNFTYRSSHVLFNGLISVIFFNMLYKLYMII